MCNELLSMTQVYSCSKDDHRSRSVIHDGHDPEGEEAATLFYNARVDKPVSGSPDSK